MAINSLPIENAFDDGSELWIIPDRRNSYWAKRIDWHLQFLISRSMIHEAPKISEKLKQIIKENEIESDVWNTPKNAPLLIFSVDLLPNRETIHLPYGTSFKTWVERAHHLWSDLKKPSARIFLPKAQDVEEFIELWPESKKEKAQVTVVVDIGGH